MCTYDARQIRFRLLLVSGIVASALFVLLYTVVKDEGTNFTKYLKKIPNPILQYTMGAQKTRHKVCQTYYDGMGIGNLMFAYAASFGIAKTRNMDLVVKKNYLTEVFKIDATVSTNMAECKKAKQISPKKECAFDKTLFDVYNNSDLNVCRYLQSYHYFHNHSSELRKQFAFKDDISAKANTIFQNVLNKLNITDRSNVTLIGVHNRRGDMVEKRLISYGYKVATKEYLHKAVKWYTSKFHNPHFIVISNDQNWTKANMPSNISAEYISQGNTPAVDMAVVTKCDHFISSVGSFSWWSGWLIGGNVTYVKDPARNGTSLRSCYSSDYSDYFLPHWIGL